MSSSVKINNHNGFDDVKVYNDFASAAVVLSSAHVSKAGILTFIRSAGDIDNNEQRRYLYSFLLKENEEQTKRSCKQTIVPLSLAPAELRGDIKARIPSPSGAKLAIFREEKVNETDSAAQVLEIWDEQSLIRRIVLPSNLHGKVISDEITFGNPSWDASNNEQVIVYAAERKSPQAKSFFQHSDGSAREEVIIGGENTLGIGKMESWGEKYSKQSALLDLFCINTETGKVGRINNVPGGTTRATTEGGYTFGQPMFSPDGKSVVYVSWDAGGGQHMPKRLGFIFCQQRPSKIFSSPVKKLLSRLSNSDSEKKQADGHDDDEDEGFECLTPDFRQAISPRFGPSPLVTATHDPNSNVTTANATLVFLASKNGFDTHFGNLALYAMDWILVRAQEEPEAEADSGFCPDASSERIVIDHVWNPQYEQGLHAVEGIPFPGLFMTQLPPQCFVSSDELLVTTSWASTTKIVKISIRDRNFEVLNFTFDENGSSKPVVDSSASQCLLCVTPGAGAVVMESSPNQPGIVGYISLKTDRDVSRNIALSIVTTDQYMIGKGEDRMQAFFKANLVSRMPSIASSKYSSTKPSLPIEYDISYQVLNLELPRSNDNDGVGSIDVSKTPLQCILLKPFTSSFNSKHVGRHPPSPPLIVVPHGGPHSVSTTTYTPGWSYLCACGYAVLLVNYRGSIGFGQAFVESLLGNIGDMDVKDVVHATQFVIDKLDFFDPSTKIGICGGSHGGFLAAHCIGQYPDMFQAAVMRNPVTNIAAMVSATDIPDWCYVETSMGEKKYNWKKFKGPTEEQLRNMWQKSPIAHSANVMTPTLVAIGMKDLRVPPSQGMEWYYTLRSAGVECKLLVYDDCDHAIDGVASQADHWVNIKRWFDKYLCVGSENC